MTSPVRAPPLVAALLALGWTALPGQTGPSCCDAGINMGFSEELVRGGALFEGIVGPGEGCTAGEGEIVSGRPAGTVRTQRVHVNIVSNLVNEHVQGWSYGVALDGAAVVDVRSLTVAGTAGDAFPIGYFDQNCDFRRTQVIDPAKNGGQRGFVIAWGRTCGGGFPPALMPSVGTESILAADIAPEAPQGAADQLAALRFQDGLIGSGQAVNIYISVAGESAPVCNVASARVSLVFRQSGPAHLRRGDSNGDARVDIADAIWTLNGLFLGGPPSPCADAADADDDGRETISDPLRLIGYIFSSGIAPPPPGPDVCGPDPTEDALDCAEILVACP